VEFIISAALTIPRARTTVMTTNNNANPSPALPLSTGSLAGSAAAVAAGPALMSVSRTGTASHLTVDLLFDSAMAKGAGIIYITDGAVQTVIDRVTGQPVMRIVGGTDTHQISAASVNIDGKHVSFEVDGLSPDHSYSVVMASGVLLAADQRPFAGVRGTADYQFTAPAGDTQAPTVVSTDLSATTLKAGGTIDVTIKFSEAVPTLDSAALSAEHATVSDLRTADGGITWQATLQAPATPTSVFGSQLSIDLSKVRDAAGNAGNHVEALAGYAVDTTPPAAALRLDSAQLSTGHSINATIQFDAAVSGLSAASFKAPHATVSNVTTADGGLTWHATVTADAGTEALSAMSYLSLDMSTVRDQAGNPGSGTLNSETGYYVDTRAPLAVSATLDATTLSPGATTQLTLIFSEAIPTLDPAAISAPHASVGSLLHVSDNTWRVTLTATDSTPPGGSVVSIDMSKLRDGFGNSGSGTFQSPSSYVIDGGAPTLKSIALDGSRLYGDGGIGITIQFSEAVPSLEASAFVAPNATVSGLHTTDHITWYGTLKGVPGTASGGGVLGIDMSKVIDAAGNAGSGTAHAADSYVVDTAAPTVAGAIAFDGSALGMSDVIVATVTLSEAVAGFPAEAVNAPNALVLGVFPTTEDMKVWTVVLQAGASGIDAPANVFTIDMSKLLDLAGNKGSGSVSSPSYSVDTRLDIGLYDSGWSETDGITNGGEQSLGGAFLDRSETGQTVKVEIDGVLLADDKVKIYHNDEVNVASWRADVDFSDGAHQIRVWLVDGSGAASATTTQNFMVDTHGPQIVSPLETGSVQDVAKPLEIQFSEAVYWDAYADGDNYATARLWNLDTGTSTNIYVDERNLSADRTKLTIKADDMHLADGGHYKLVLNGSMADLAGNWLGENEIGFTASGNYIDTTGPSAVRAEAYTWSSWWGDAYPAGTVVYLTVRFSEPVHVVSGKAPSLTLNTGGVAVYDSINADGRAITFKYTVAAGDSDTPRLAIADSSKLAGAIADQAGNLLDTAHINYSVLEHGSGGYGSDIIAIDTHAPSAPTGLRFDPDSDTGDFNNDRITKDTTPNLFISGVEAGAYDVRIYEGGKVIGYGYATDDDGWRATINDGEKLSDGVHHLSVTQVDRAGNESPISATLDITIDTIAPVAPSAPALAAGSDTGAAGDHITSDSTPTFTGSGAEPGRTVRLYANEREVGRSIANDKGEWSITVSDTMADGSYSFGVKQFDLAGNKSGYSDSFTLTIETGAPAAPTLALAAATDTGSLGDGITKTENPIIQGKGEAGAKLELFDGTKLLLSTTVNPDGTWSMIPALAEGVHQLNARQTDNAGNVGVLSDFLRIVVDKTAAALSAPLLAVASDSGLLDNDGITKVTKPVITGSGAEAGATIEIWDGAVKLGQTNAGSGGAWTFIPSSSDAALADGTHTLTAKQIDLAGNTSAASAPLALTIDTTAAAAPGAPKLARESDSGKLDNDAITNVTKPLISGSGAEAKATIELYDGGALLGKTTADASGAWSFTTGLLAAGLHSLTAKQIDAAGNGSLQSALLNLRIDTAAPAALSAPTLDADSDSGASSRDGITNVKSLTIRGAGAEANAAIDVYDGATLLGHTIASDTGAWEYRTADLLDGLHALSAKQVNLAGNASAASAALSVTIDTVAPTVIGKAVNLLQRGYSLEFSESIVFANGKEIDVDFADLLPGNHASRHLPDSRTNWGIEDGAHGVQNQLALKIGVVGLFHMQMATGAIQDLAGNAAVIGVSDLDFRIGLTF
jgi:hypothetical protein